MAIDFASSAYVANGTTGLPTGDADVSLSAWVKIGTMGFSVIFGYGDGSTTRASPILYIVNGTTISFGLWADDVTYVSGSLAGAWHHMAGTFRASTNELILYLDGAQVNSKTAGGNGAFSAARCRTGCSISASPDLFYIGQVEDARIFSRVLEAEEVAYLAAGGRQALGGEVLWHSYDDFQGVAHPDGAVLAGANVVPDRSSQGNDGIPTTSPTARASEAPRVPSWFAILSVIEPATSPASGVAFQLSVQHPADGSWRDLTADVLAYPGIKYEYGVRTNDIAERTGTTGQLVCALDNDINLGQYGAWYNTRKAASGSVVGGGPYTPNNRFLDSDGAAFDLFNYPVRDASGVAAGDYWFQIGNRVRLMEYESRVSSTRDGAYIGAVSFERIRTASQFGTRYVPMMPGATSAIDLFSLDLASDFDGATGSLYVGLAAVDNWTTVAARREIAYLYVDASNWIDLYHTSDGVPTIEYRAGGVTHSWSGPAGIAGTSDAPSQVAMGLSWSSDQTRFYMNVTSTDQAAERSVVATTGTWAGAPTLFLLGATTSDGASNSLKAAFTGCALWKSEVEPRNLFPINHHLNWYPDWLASIDYSHQIAYWPLTETSGTTVADWHATPLYFKLSGRIKDIRPAPGKFGTNAVAITVLDWFDDAAKFSVGAMPTQVDVTMDEAILQLVGYASSQPAGLILTTGADILPFTTHDIRGVNAVLGEISKLAATEFGYAYMRGTVNSEEVPGMALVNESRHSRVTNTTAAFTIADDGTSDAIRNIAVAQDLDSLRNTIEVTTHPANVDTDNVVVSSLPAAVVLEVPSGGSFIYAGKYLDSDNAFRVVGAASIVAPVRNTDFLINTTPTGSGTDLSNDFRQNILSILGANLRAYYVLNDSPSNIFQNEADITGASNASGGSGGEGDTSITGATGGNTGKPVTYQKASLSTSGCFLAGTPVDTPFGPCPIETLDRGDLVWITDEEPATILSVLIATRADLVEVVTDAATVVCSPNHRFAVPDGWCEASSLAGKTLERGQRVVSVLPFPGEHQVYNLEVNHPLHQYRVAGLLVHNAKTATY